MPFAPQQLPWYIIVAQWGQIVAMIMLPLFMIASIVMSLLLYLKLRMVAKAVAPISANEESAAIHEIKPASEAGNEPDISEFVE